jgi:LruC domain-containing protein
VNFTIWDDDGGVTNATVEIKIMTAYEMKEEAVRLLEPLVPGRWDHVGYQNLTLKFLGVKDPTVLAYNHISREPYYWETKLLYTFCNVDPGETIFVDASTLPTGIFGDKLILKTYDEECGLVDETEIPTAYSCLNILKPGQRYGPWEIVEVGMKNGTTYQHYTRFAREVEDAMDNILFSIGKDPRRGYGWWHTHWIWYCGYWFERTLWIDDSRLDPQYGTIVFCEERNAVKHLMSVINNCLNCDGVHNMTLQWTGKEKVDIEVYSYGLWWKWYNQWEHTHSFEEIAPGDTFFIGSRGYPLCGKLAKRTLIKIHKYNTGELLDAVYMRTSGFWPLEVEPGNLYGNVLIVNTTLKLGCGNFYFYDPWFTDDYWHDWGWQPWYGDESAFDYYDWQVSRSSPPVSRSKQCGWTEDCWDDAIAAEEEARICSNLSVIKTVIKLLVLADELIARVAHWDAQNLTANVVANQDEYEYHLKMAKRYMLRARREANEGKPHRAIRDYKLSWKNSMLAMRWVVKDFEDFNGTVDPGVSEKWADFDIECYCMCGDGNQGVKTPWWLWFYMLNQWRYKMRFAFFPNWREFTDPEVWGGDPNETYEYESDECNDPSYRAVEKSMYIGYEDYYSDYDYNDWGMKLYEKRHVKTNTNKIGKLELKFVADAKEAGYKHYIHLAINLESNVEYTWEMKFYDEEDNLQSTQESSGVESGDFDERLFDTAKYPWGHDLKPKYVVVIIDFEEDIFPMHLSQAPYDTYMYVRTTGKYIHSYTTRPTTESEAAGSDPSLADKYVPMMLVVDDDAWEPPMDGQRIWKKYDKFDDWVLKGYPGDENWWD